MNSRKFWTTDTKQFISSKIFGDDLSPGGLLQTPVRQSRTFHRYAVPQQELAGVHMVSYCTSSQNLMYPYRKHMDPSSFLLWLKFFKLKYLDSQEPRRCQKMLGSGDFNPLPGILTLIVFSWKMWPQSEKLVILSEHHQLITAVVHHKFARVNGKSTLPLIEWQTTFHCWTNPQLKSRVGGGGGITHLALN